MTGKAKGIIAGSFIAVLAICFFIYAAMCIEMVPAGHVGVKVYLLGQSKGVDSEVLTPGRYWIGYNERLYLFPTYQQTAEFTKANGNMVAFQTKEGLSISANVGMSYKVNPEKVSILFQTYRRGVDEITQQYLSAIIRDAFVLVSSTKEVESIYGAGKSDLVTEVKARVIEKMSPLGIEIDFISIIGDPILPSNVVAAINAKIEATQKAQQRQNELAQARAEADKVAAEADGRKRAAILDAQAKAEAIDIESIAQAKANVTLAKSITPELIQYKAIEKWVGNVPTYTGSGAVPFLELK